MNEMQNGAVDTTGQSGTADLGWRPMTMEEAVDLTPLPRLDRYVLRSRALPEPGVRDVFVYRPPQYETESDRRFPVFYLQDAQNLIDPRTSFIPGETWDIHTTADRLALAGEIEPVILVGVSNAGLRRLAEYTPGRDITLGSGGEGRSYGRLLIEDLKPLVDITYRTCTGPEYTGIGGSSLGGLISLFLALERPDVFGKVAAMSPSVWWDQRSILHRLSRAVPRPPLKVWIDMGSEEGARHLRDAGMLVRQMMRQGWREGIDLEYFIAQGAGHNERAWAERFDRVLRFLFPPRAPHSQDL